MSHGVQVAFKKTGGTPRKFASEDDPFPVTITGTPSVAVGSTPTQTRSDTYVATATGTTVNATTAPKQNFSLQVNQTGTVTSWTVVLEGSLDGTNFTTLITHTDADGSGTVKTASGKPALYFRSRCSAITLGAGTNVIATILGMT